jgi:hypothetical protein
MVLMMIESSIPLQVKEVGNYPTLFPSQPENQPGKMY